MNAEAVETKQMSARKGDMTKRLAAVCRYGIIQPTPHTGNSSTAEEYQEKPHISAVNPDGLTNGGEN
jgi:hypothetical protein